MTIYSLPSRELLDSLDRNQLMIVEAMFEVFDWSDRLTPHRCKEAAFEAMEKQQKEDERRYLAYLEATHPERWWYDPDSPHYFKYSSYSDYENYLRNLLDEKLIEQSMQWHHINPVPTPQWKIATDAITIALNGH